jgi:NACalpha-BTF3-like transcription factor
LAAVKVDAADCALLAAELELSTKDADRLLREHNGDLSATLKAFVNK